MSFQESYGGRLAAWAIQYTSGLYTIDRPDAKEYLQESSGSGPALEDFLAEAAERATVYRFHLAQGSF
jgi:TPR repeat protein